MHSLQPESDYQRFLCEGRFMLQRSRQGGGYVFYPRVAEPGTGNTDLEWVEASGRGVVYSTTVVRQRPPTPNYNVALIDLEEGVRLMSRVEGVAPEAVRIGMAVKAKILRDDPAAAVLVFEPA
ncbi:Zn-ribbon domain-containing OB-fold protein [Pseudomonas citronellolis]|uniref:Zn-ribbon domain-containing OB-fold protein n=1 Tax=Pseudomonas citronellolis TaxID=53408 RepID=UPI0021C24D0B|nr:OB-fold domain-containing protein [Pseudomonas citronellolis]UXJ50222.1 OB-fold domain-containing protein [Pseudomonas citronellolis]